MRLIGIIGAILLTGSVFAADIPANILGAEKLNAQDCVNNTTDNCVTNTCLNSTNRDCQADCADLASKSCADKLNN